MVALCLLISTFFTRLSSDQLPADGIIKSSPSLHLWSGGALHNNGIHFPDPIGEFYAVRDLEFYVDDLVVSANRVIL